MTSAPGPDPDLAARRYRSRASGYDASARRTFGLRRLAVDRLCLVPGDRVLDVACGTGLSFPLLRDGIGESGSVTGVDVSGAMTALAQERVAAAGWRNVRVITAPMEQAALDGPYDAVLFNYTHDVLQSPAALAKVLAQLQPGARVALAGIKHPSGWLWPLRLWRLFKARPYVTTLSGLDAPWARLLPSLADFRLTEFMLGTNYVAWGRVRADLPRAAG